MLFLAVFCGFLAEYQLEHKIEKERGKEYATALYNDIVSDTSDISNNIQYIRQVIAFEDTLIGLLEKMSVDGEKVPEAKLYYYALRCRGGALLSVKTSTLNQLKNSGALRMLKKPHLIRLFADYDQAIENESQRSNDNQYTRDAQERCFQNVFNYKVMVKVERLLGKDPASRDSILELHFPLLNSDEKSISDLSYALILRRYNLGRRVEKYYSEPLDAGIKLLEAIKKEYHLK